MRSLRLVGFSLVLVCAFQLSSCGLVHLGNGNSNSSAPSGSLIASGAFTSLNGQTVSGGASIYNDNGTYYLYINGLVAPSANGLVFIVTVSGSPLPQIALSSTTGSTTYALSVGVSNPVFQTVRLNSTTNNQDYGEAYLN